MKKGVKKRRRYIYVQEKVIFRVGKCETNLSKLTHSSRNSFFFSVIRKVFLKLFSLPLEIHQMAGFIFT